MSNRLALGTAQFGFSYGIANRVGRVSQEEVSAILGKAASSGVDMLDTAVAYGDSERCLGAVGVSGWRVVSKLPAIPSGCVDVSVWVSEQVKSSLSRLRINKLYGLLLHRPEQLHGEKGSSYWDALQAMKQEGWVEKIGFSIYDPLELDLLYPSYPPDLVQAPYNVFDRRLVESGWLECLWREGVEVHVRSVFLQGLLLMASEERPQLFQRWSSLWGAWEDWLRERRMTAVEACLAFVLSESRISKVVVGVDSLRQFEEILSASEKPSTVGSVPEELTCSDLGLINPSRWGVL